MVDIEKIRELTSHPRILEFASFVLLEGGRGVLPDYKKLDLIKIPKCIPCIWVIDYRASNHDDLVVKFTGSKLDEFWKTNVQKLGSIKKLYHGDDYEDVVPKMYHSALADKKVAYSLRYVHFHDDSGGKRVCIESIMFPCSSNGKDVDYGIGYVDYNSPSLPQRNTYLLL